MQQSRYYAAQERRGSASHCHEPGTETSRTVTQIYDQITSANNSYQDAQTTVEQARSLGMIVAEEDDLLIVDDEYGRLVHDLSAFGERVSGKVSEHSGKS